MFSSFKPEKDAKLNIPFFDDVTAADGWEGHTTSKSITTLQSEISSNMSRLNCVVTGFLGGSYSNRTGYQIHFAMRNEGGTLVPSRLDIACLPLKVRTRYRRGPDPRIEGAKKMALYMVNKSLKGMFFFSVLAPGFIPFMSLMLDNKQQTLGQIWAERGSLLMLQPPQDADFIESNVEE